MIYYLSLFHSSTLERNQQQQQLYDLHKYESKTELYEFWFDYHFFEGFYADKNKWFTLIESGIDPETWITAFAGVFISKLVSAIEKNLLHCLLFFLPLKMLH